MCVEGACCMITILFAPTWDRLHGACSRSRIQSTIPVLTRTWTGVDFVEILITKVCHVLVTWFSRAASSATRWWCRNRSREGTRGEFDGASVAGWCGCSAALGPRLAIRNMYATTCGSELNSSLITDTARSVIEKCYLVCDSNEDGAEKKVSAERIFNLNLWSRAAEEYPGQLSENRQGDHEVVSISFDPVVSRDRSGVDVVFPERSQEILADDWQFNWTPGVSGPVHKTGSEICRQDAADGREDHGAEPFHPEMPDNQIRIDDHQRETRVHANDFLRSLACGTKTNP